MSWAEATTSSSCGSTAQNPAILEAKADEVRAAIAGIDGLEDAQVELPPEEPTIEVQPDVEPAEALRARAGRRAPRRHDPALGPRGRATSSRSRRCSTWRCGATRQIRQSEADVEDLLIDTPDGGLVPLGDVADVRVVPNPAVIRHESVDSYVDVTANVSGRDVGDVAGEVDEAVAAGRVPARAPRRGPRRLRGAQQPRAPASSPSRWPALIAIFLLLQAAFASWRLAILALPDPADGARRRRAGGADRRRRHHAGLGGRASSPCSGSPSGAPSSCIRHYQRPAARRVRPSDADLVTRGTRDRLAPILTSALACGRGPHPVRDESAARQGSRSSARWPSSSSAGWSRRRC